MSTTFTNFASQIIKATTGKNFIEQLDTRAQAKTLTNRAMATLGLWGEGAVLDAIDTATFDGLKVGEKLEIAMSPETQACHPALIKSIHLVGNDIVVNGAANLFTYPQAEEVVRGVANFLRSTNAKNVIMGGIPNGCDAWFLPKNGAPISLSAFGMVSVLPFEGYLLARDLVTGGGFYLTPEYIGKCSMSRQYWSQFYSPANETYVASFSHRVRDGYLYATLRCGANTVVEAWNVRPLLQNRKIETNALPVRPEWVSTWGTEMVGPVDQCNAIAMVSPNAQCITFYGMAAPTATTPRT